MAIQNVSIQVHSCYHYVTYLKNSILPPSSLIVHTFPNPPTRNAPYSENMEKLQEADVTKIPKDGSNIDPQKGLTPFKFNFTFVATHILNLFMYTCITMANIPVNITTA